MDGKEQDQPLSAEDMYKNAKCEIAALQEENKDLRSRLTKSDMEKHKYSLSFRTLVAEITKGMK